MGDLRTLIRFHRWQIDEKRRALAELQNQEDQVLAFAAQLEEQIKAEQQTARTQSEVAFGYANYAKAAIHQRARIAETLAQVRDQLIVATDDLAEAFQELKRYELAQEERVKREKAEIRRKENEMLDETAEIGFRRRQESAE
jgi:hypothetical protein